MKETNSLLSGFLFFYFFLPKQRVHFYEGEGEKRSKVFVLPVTIRREHALFGRVVRLVVLLAGHRVHTHVVYTRLVHAHIARQ